MELVRNCSKREKASRWDRFAVLIVSIVSEGSFRVGCGHKT